VKIAQRLGGRLDDSQGGQIAPIGGKADLLVTVEIAHALVHGRPDHDDFAAATTFAADFELGWIVDDRWTKRLSPWRAWEGLAIMLVAYGPADGR
jgi:hypothetical protein